MNGPIPARLQDAQDLPRHQVAVEDAPHLDPDPMGTPWWRPWKTLEDLGTWGSEMRTEQGKIYGKMR